jgi:hypothetical protein
MVQCAHYGIEIDTSVYFFYFLKCGNKNGGNDVGDGGGDVTNVDRPMYVADVNSFYFPWFMILWIYSYIVSQGSSLYSKNLHWFCHVTTLINYHVLLRPGTKTRSVESLYLDGSWPINKAVRCYIFFISHALFSWIPTNSRHNIKQYKHFHIIEINFGYV